MKINQTTSNCAFDPLVLNADTSGVVLCTVVGGPSTVKGSTIKLTRDLNGSWSCGTTAKQKFVGAKEVCSGAAN
jgi:hypothetical protein